MMETYSFPVERSKVDIRAAGFQANRSKWDAVLCEFNAKLKQVCTEGDATSLKRHQERGQLLRMSCLHLHLMCSDGVYHIARDRISLLLDSDSPFLELGPFAGFEVSGSNNCANLIAGIGLVWCALLDTHTITLNGWLTAMEAGDHV